MNNFCIFLFSTAEDEKQILVFEFFIKQNKVNESLQALRSGDELYNPLFSDIL